MVQCARVALNMHRIDLSHSNLRARSGYAHLWRKAEIRTGKYISGIPEPKQVGTHILSKFCCKYIFYIADVRRKHMYVRSCVVLGTLPVAEQHGR